MQPPNNHETLHNTAAAVDATDSIQVTELAVLLDAIPPEYREDVLLAALWLGTNQTFQESYMVTSLRNQLCDCLMEWTSTLQNLKILRHPDRATLQRRLNQFTKARDMGQITFAIENLLEYLASTY